MAERLSQHLLTRCGDVRGQLSRGKCTIGYPEEGREELHRCHQREKSQVSAPSAQHGPWIRALVPICTWVAGLPSQPDMVPCSGRSPKQHPGTRPPPDLRPQV